jgi:hypothetical protein
MQKEKIAAIALGLIVVGALSGYILANNWEYIYENLFGPEVSLKANDDIVSFNINSVNNNVKILDNDEFDDDSDISIEIVNDPSYGDIEVNGTSISYTPNADYMGEDSFTYNLKDQSGSISKATVLIEVAFGVIEIGDCADVFYIGKFTNGTVFDTNKEDVARENGLYDENRPFIVANVFVDPDMGLVPPDGYENYSSGFITGFLEGLIGMKQGDIKNATIEPEKGYGIWNKSLAEELFSFYFQTPYWPRKVTNPIDEQRTKSELLNYNSSINLSAISEGYKFDYIEAENQEGEPIYWQIEITNISGDNVTLRNVIENNTVLKSEGMWDNVIIIENETYFSIRGDPEYDIIYGSPGFFMKLVDLNETAIVVEINVDSPEARFIGQTLIFQLEVEEVYKTSDQLES